MILNVFAPVIIKAPLLPGIKILLIVFRKKGELEAGGTTIHVSFFHNSTVFFRVVEIKPTPLSTGDY